jgi:hypothetical protein
MNYSELLSDIQKSIEAGELKGALTRLQTLSTHGDVPKMIKQRIHYDIGVLYYKYIGNGVLARENFKKVVELANDKVLSSDSRSIELVAYSLDNLLLLCLSFDEYKSLSNEISKLPAVSPTLSMTDGIEEMESKGSSWVDVMGYMACYAGDMEDNPLMATIFQLMLKNRKLLRLTKDQWRNAIRTYSETIRYMLAWYGREIEIKSKQIDPEEIVFLGDDIWTFFKEYFEKYPADHDVLNLESEITGILDTLKNLNTSGIFDDIQRNLDAGELDVALKKLNNLYNNTDVDKKIRIEAHYNLGLFFSERLGNGRLARQNFIKAIEKGLDPELCDDTGIIELVKKSREKLILFSLSYDEFEGNASEILKISIDSPVSQMLSDVKSWRLKGHPWHVNLGFMSNLAGERNNHTLMVAIIQLLLSNREILGYDKDLWKALVKIYADKIAYLMRAHVDKYGNSKMKREEAYMFSNDALYYYNDYLSKNIFDLKMRSSELIFKGELRLLYAI